MVTKRQLLRNGALGEGGLQGGFLALGQAAGGKLSDSSLAESKTDGFNVAHPILYAVDGSTMTVLWHTAADELSHGGKYILPVIADGRGRVYLSTDRLRVYGWP
jgi:hypothetical protein